MSNSFNTDKLFRELLEKTWRHHYTLVVGELWALHLLGKLSTNFT